MLGVGITWRIEIKDNIISIVPKIEFVGNKKNVSEASAIYFFIQCAGFYNESTGSVARNPKIQEMVISHGAEKSHDFAIFLRNIADQLDRVT